MTLHPERDPAAGGYGHLRASHADRERAADVLKAAFAEGRLSRDEFEERTEQVYRSRTYAELAALTADLRPARSVLCRHRGQPCQRNGRGRTGQRSGRVRR